MKFKIIRNEHTPAVQVYKDTHQLLSDDLLMLEKFISFARLQKMGNMKCVGLAANQVAMDGVRIQERFFAIKEGSFWHIIIEPTILKLIGKKEQKIENCLTWPGKKIIAERWPEIKASWYNLRGECVRKNLTGFIAQIWQHEYGHLYGIKEKFVGQ